MESNSFSTARSFQSVGIDGPDGLDEFRKSDAQSAVFVDDHAVAIEDELVIAADLIKVYERDSVFFRGGAALWKNVVFPFPSETASPKGL